MEEKKYIDLEGLAEYNKKLKKHIDDVFGDFSDLEKKLEKVKKEVSNIGEE